MVAAGPLSGLTPCTGPGSTLFTRIPPAWGRPVVTNAILEGGERVLAEPFGARP